MPPSPMSRVFISWSGTTSKRVAKLFHDWLPNVIQQVEPYFSSEIDKGARWFSDISDELAESRFGIICLTRENKDAPWILFEAGALANKLEQSRVSPFLIDLPPSALEGPLSKFQTTEPGKEEVKRLVTTINDHLETGALRENRLDQVFEKWWPDFESELEDIKSAAEPVTEQEERDTEDMIQEILENTRALARMMAQLERKSSKSTARRIEEIIGQGSLDFKSTFLQKVLEEMRQERRESATDKARRQLLGGSGEESDEEDGNDEEG